MIGTADHHATGAYHAAVVAGIAFAAVMFLAALRRKRVADPARRAAGAVGRLAWIVTWVCILVLGLTAFGTVLTAGTMGGYPLMLHTAAGGVLCVALGAFALAGSGARRTGLARVTFWAILVLGLGAAVSMLAAMLPWYETATLEVLLDVHRWSGLGLFVVTALHVRLVR